MPTIPLIERDAMNYAIDAYDETTAYMIGANPAKWLEICSKMWYQRVLGVRLLMIIRHGIDIDRKKLQARMGAKERTADHLENAEESAVEDASTRSASSKRGPSKSEQREQSPVIPRPPLSQRNIGDIEEVYALGFKVRCAGINSRFESTIEYEGRLRMAEFMLPELFSVNIGGVCVGNLTVTVRTPWTFLLQSSLNVTGEKTGRGRSTCIPMFQVERDDDRYTLCDLSNILQAFLPALNCRVCQLDLNFVLNDASFFTNCVLATGTEVVAPVRCVRVRITIEGLEVRAKRVRSISPEEYHGGIYLYTDVPNKKARLHPPSNVDTETTFGPSILSDTAPRIATLNDHIPPHRQTSAQYNPFVGPSSGTQPRTVDGSPRDTATNAPRAAPDPRTSQARDGTAASPVPSRVEAANSAKVSPQTSLLAPSAPPSGPRAPSAVATCGYLTHARVSGSAHGTRPTVTSSNTCQPDERTKGSSQLTPENAPPLCTPRQGNAGQTLPPSDSPNDVRPGLGRPQDPSLPPRSHAYPRSVPPSLNSERPPRDPTERRPRTDASVPRADDVKASTIPTVIVDPPRCVRSEGSAPAGTTESVERNMRSSKPSSRINRSKVDKPEQDQHPCTLAPSDKYPSFHDRHRFYYVPPGGDKVHTVPQDGIESADDGYTHAEPSQMAGASGPSPNIQEAATAIGTQCDFDDTILFPLPPDIEFTVLHTTPNSGNAEPPLARRPIITPTRVPSLSEIVGTMPPVIDSCKSWISDEPSLLQNNPPSSNSQIPVPADVFVPTGPFTGSWLEAYQLWNDSRTLVQPYNGTPSLQRSEVP